MALAFTLVKLLLIIKTTNLSIGEIGGFNLCSICVDCDNYHKNESI